MDRYIEGGTAQKRPETAALRPGEGLRLLQEAVRRSRFRSAALLFVPLFAVPLLALSRPALLVTVDGRPVGYVAREGVLSAAVDRIETRTRALAGAEFSLKADIALTPRLTTSELLTDDLEAALAGALDEVAEVTLVRVNGEPVSLLHDRQAAEQALALLKARYTVQSSDRVELVERVELCTVVTAPSLCAAPEVAARELGEAVTVSVTRELTYTEDIPYETITRETDRLPLQSRAVLREGRSGEAEVTAELTLLNGMEQRRTILSRIVRTPPTDALIEVGTRDPGFGTGELQAPVSDYTVSSPFGHRRLDYHRGIDLLTPEGSEVYAADNGQVIVAEYHPSYGNYVLLDHRNGMQTLYAHNSALCVAVGDTVAKGELLAYAGSTGDSCAPHCHFEVRIDGTAVDPAKHLAL